MNGTLSRSVVAYDVADILSATDTTTRLLAEIPVVATEKLSPDELRGKQIDTSVMETADDVSLCSTMGRLTPAVLTLSDTE